LLLIPSRNLFLEASLTYEKKTMDLILFFWNLTLMDLASSSSSFLQSLNNLHCTFAHTPNIPFLACFLYLLGSDSGLILPSGFWPLLCWPYFLLARFATFYYRTTSLHKYAKVRKVMGTVPVKQSTLLSIRYIIASACNMMDIWYDWRRSVCLHSSSICSLVIGWGLEAECKYR
jgi:hypothetical protein